MFAPPTAPHAPCPFTEGQTVTLKACPAEFNSYTGRTEPREAITGLIVQHTYYMPDPLPSGPGYWRVVAAPPENLGLYTDSNAGHWEAG